MTGRYCSTCGQERIGAHDLSARRFLQAVCLIAVYLFVAIRRVYARPARNVLLRWAIVLVTILAFNHLADVTAIRLTLALV